MVSAPTALVAAGKSSWLVGPASGPEDRALLWFSADAHGALRGLGRPLVGRADHEEGLWAPRLPSSQLRDSGRSSPMIPGMEASGSRGHPSCWRGRGVLSAVLSVSE